ncbi:MAG: hypothetical protein AAFX99_06505, partial [Myxococcota bacterium]
MVNIRKLLHILLLLVVMTTAAIALSSCGGDENSGSTGSPSVLMALSESSAEVGGASVSISVTAFLGGGAFMPPGTVVDIGELDFLTSGVNAIGHFDDPTASDSNRGQTSKMILTNGAVSANYYCNSAGTTTLVALPRGLDTSLAATTSFDKTG